MAQKIIRLVLRSFFILLLLCISVPLLFDVFFQNRMDDKRISDYFIKKHTPFQLRYFQLQYRNIRCISSGSDTSATIVFLHGSPGSCTYFKDYMSDTFLLSKAKMISIERPGYGYSGFGNAEPSIVQQASIIKKVIDSLHQVHHPVILVGVSYGSSVACRMAMNYPGLIDGLVLIGPSLAPGEEKTFWFTPALQNPLLHWLVPRMYQAANTEKIQHKSELEKMLPSWKNIRIPVMYMQGANDQWIDTGNALFAKTHLVNAPSLDIQIFPGQGHEITFTEKAAIENTIIKIINVTKH